MRFPPIPGFSVAPRRTRRAAGCVAGLLLTAGCSPTTRPDFNSPEPGARNEAIVEAAANDDRSKLPDLVRMLDSDDGATRLLAIRTIERFTGETLGYDYRDDREARAAAIERWRVYVNQQRGSPSGQAKPGDGR